MGQHNIIELNGKQYDALTGALLGESRVRATQATQQKLHRSGRNIDGFVRGQGHHTHTSAPVVVKPAPAPIKPSQTHVSGKKVMGDIRPSRHKQPAKPLAAHRPEKPKTLMRHVVKKPQVKMKTAIKTTGPSEVMARPASSVMKPLEKKMSVTQVNPVRLVRARQVPKSHHIRRFSPTPSHTVHHTVTNAVQQRPTQYANRTVRQTPTTAAAQVTAPQSTPKNDQTAADIFEAALAHATSHEQKTPVHIRRHATRRRRLVNVMAGLGAFLVIAGFIAYLNKPTIELRVASMRAGFHAEMPSYKPTGYALEGGIQSSEGKVAMNFRSGTNSYTITQEASDWNSSTLLDQESDERGQPARTIQSKGRTIYLYNDSSATWVNGGVRYEISGNAPLDASELVSLATSM